MTRSSRDIVWLAITLILIAALIGFAVGFNMGGTAALTELLHR
jgi:hypothetical protein